MPGGIENMPSRSPTFSFSLSFLISGHDQRSNSVSYYLENCGDHITAGCEQITRSDLQFNQFIYNKKTYQKNNLLISQGLLLHENSRLVNTKKDNLYYHP